MTVNPYLGGFMSNNNKSLSRIRGHFYSDQSGAILIIVAISLVILVGITGLAIDLGHAFVNKSQLQNIADACALAGASALNETTAGIVEAQSRATNNTASGLNNKFEFNSNPLTIDAAWVTYSTALNGTYMAYAAAQGSPAGIKFVKVAIPSAQASEVLFGTVIPGIPNVINLGAEAIAGRANQQQVCNGVLDPFAAPPGPPPGLSDPTGNFGYIAGYVYEVRFAPGNSGHNCSTIFPLNSTTGNFGFADPDGIGGSMTDFRREILDTTPGGNCVKIDLAALDPNTGGSGNAALQAIQDRFDQDTNSAPYTTLAAYNSGYVNSSTNGRRIIRVAFRDNYVPPGMSGRYNVVGFGCFFMADRPDANPPSSAVCLMYIGGCGTSGNATGSSNQPSLTRTILFQ
jgi:Flp pilus assembly protein TadG